MATVSFELFPKPPFRLDLTVWVLRRRPHNLIDRWDGRTYQRVLVIQGEPALATVVQTGSTLSPRLEVTVRGKNLKQKKTISPVKDLLTKMLGLNADLEHFYRMAAQDRHLRELVQPFRGVRPPRFPGCFEALANAIACQQLSLTVGIHLLNRLTVAYGPVFEGAEEGMAAFPRARDLAGADLESLRRLGFSRTKARSLVNLAEGVAQGRIDLENLEMLKDGEIVKYLAALPGIGRWSAEYVLLRGLGRWRVFPGDDVGARKRLQAWLKLPGPLTYQDVDRLLARWAPFGGLVYFHLLLSQLAKEGEVAG